MSDDSRQKLLTRINNKKMECACRPACRDDRTVACRPVESELDKSSELLLLFLSLIAGCATARPPRVDLPEIAKSRSMTMRDDRPALVHKREVMS